MLKNTQSLFGNWRSLTNSVRKESAMHRLIVDLQHGLDVEIMGRSSVDP